MSPRANRAATLRVAPAPVTEDASTRRRRGCRRVSSSMTSADRSHEALSATITSHGKQHCWSKRASICSSSQGSPFLTGMMTLITTSPSRSVDISTSFRSCELTTCLSRPPDRREKFNASATGIVKSSAGPRACRYRAGTRVSRYAGTECHPSARRGWLGYLAEKA